LVATKDEKENSNKELESFGWSLREAKSNIFTVSGCVGVDHHCISRDFRDADLECQGGLDADSVPGSRVDFRGGA